MSEKIIRCKNCGEEIFEEEILCYDCITEEEDKYNYLTKNHSNYNYLVKNVDANETEEEPLEIIEEGASKTFPVRRFFLLLFFTCGLFEYYWFYKNSKLVYNEMNKDSNALLRTILFLIPIVNIFAYYFYLDDIKKLLVENNLRTFSPIWNLLLYMFFPILGLWSFFNVQEHLNEYWKLKEPNKQVQLNSKPNEIIVMSIIPLLTILSFLFVILAIIVISV